METPEEVEYNGARRLVFKRRRDEDDEYDSDEEHGVQDDAEDEEDEADEEDEEDDPYASIDLYEILKPITAPEEISNRESISRTYQSKVLRHFTSQSIEIIEKEQDTVMKLSSLLDFLLGEDEKDLLEAGLELPDYDHNLTPNKAQGEIDLDKRITRKSVSQENDPFFALPQFKFDPNQGLPAQEAEEARQLSQVALQRTQEFIRSLTQVRNGLSRAQYLKEKIYAWAREMNGDPDESDVYVAEKEAAAKIAQAEKEAKAALEASKEPSVSRKGTPQPGRKRGRRS